jgi:hypothetical protein
VSRDLNGGHASDSGSHGGDESARAGQELSEGWYLMNTGDLERELRRRRGESSERGEAVVRLTVGEALAYRDAGNLPDEHGRTLRLVLLARNRAEVRGLPHRRALYEPDYQAAPTWRREGSRPINVVPLGETTEPSADLPWWEEPELAALESEWLATGAIRGLRIPEAYRGFLYKTILTLRADNQEVTVAALADSLARWLIPRVAAEVRSALEAANRTEGTATQ